VGRCDFALDRGTSGKEEALIESRNKHLTVPELSDRAMKIAQSLNDLLDVEKIIVLEILSNSMKGAILIEFIQRLEERK